MILVWRSYQASLLLLCDYFSIFCDQSNNGLLCVGGIINKHAIGCNGFLIQCNERGEVDELV